jgi:hypothetical protein
VGQSLISYAALVLDLFLLAQLPLEPIDRGSDWEERVAGYLAGRSLRTDTLPGGSTVLGFPSASGIRHQVDCTIGCSDALLIGEWKAHLGSIPKNEMLRFKAVTDDYYMAMGRSLPVSPLRRLFGGPSVMTLEVRRYGALHGIALLERDRWPAVVLADHAMWGFADGPTLDERKQLARLDRSLQRVMQLQSNGTYVLLAPLGNHRVLSLLDLQQYWSDRLWQWLDDSPGRLEVMIERVRPFGLAA